ncbi:hypothetical protein DFH06DRAFT_1097627 [Mycena polygramma]|nr:hypothetical protein DFH06DRAFT_1097627 [Mycena polygramma]
MHAYTIIGMGDILAVEKLLNIKGHNGFCPCRSCKMKGARNVTGGEKIYYIPLAHPDVPGEPRRSWNPSNLPLRQHNYIIDIADRLEKLESAGAKANLAFDEGIKGLPALRRVGSLDFVRSFPWDIMHLFFENIVRILVNLWSGNFKGMDTGSENYEISPDVWEEIWRETAEAVKDIPADFVRSMADGPGKFTAESWCFWFIYMAPILLKGRFQDPKYHTHACDLVKIIKTCIAFTVTHTRISELRVEIITWLKTYEAYYYQYDEARLCACPLTLHGLVHVPDNLLFCGPGWTTWTFWVERYCGFLKGALRSKKSPWSNLSNITLQRAYLEQLDARFDVTEEIASRSTRTNGLSSMERRYDTYPQTILRRPYQNNYSPDSSLRRKIATYFRDLLGKRIDEIEPELPERMQLWGKLRIVDGDSISSAWGTRNRSEQHREKSFIRYEIEVKDRNDRGRWVPHLGYGQLDKILVCELPGSKRLWGKLAGKTRLLAVITPYRTGGRDASNDIFPHSQFLTPIVADVQSVVAVVGRLATRGKGYLLDRSGGMVRPEFIPTELYEDSDDSEEQG